MTLPLFSNKAPDPAAVIREAAYPLTTDHDHERILAEIGDASLVLLGEATHGTHDFYSLRARITRALIEERGFSAVAIEGDWPDAYRVNRYVQQKDGGADAVDALAGFERFPTWMWRNTAVSDFVGWLRAHNAGIADPAQRVGFYGLDLYSLHASMRAVIEYLDRHDPAAAESARASYACFEEFGHDTDDYAWATARLGEGTCEDAVARELMTLREKRGELLRRDGAASDEYFYAVQNARLAKNAERYYRTMFHGRVASWNIRDQHMAETLEELLGHLRERGQAPKIVVWAHNSHLGDARATEIGEDGELNVGQLVREWHGSNAKLVGFTTYAGTVIAASNWGEPGELKRVRPALEGSYEELFHRTGIDRFVLAIERGTYVHSLLAEPRLERAIGVIYRPDTERRSHYFNARLSDQFDIVIHLDGTRAVEPLEHIAAWERSEAPETYPSGV
jgi:erythromycin esterase-like protein